MLRHLRQLSLVSARTARLVRRPVSSVSVDTGEDNREWRRSRDGSERFSRENAWAVGAALVGAGTSIGHSNPPELCSRDATAWDEFLWHRHKPHKRRSVVVNGSILVHPGFGLQETNLITFGVGSEW